MVKQTANQGKKTPLAHSVGRRKRAVARVWFKRGSGKVRVNGHDMVDYFDTDTSFLTASMPFRLAPISSNYDVQVNVQGGGKVSQADAIKLALSRGLVSLDEALRKMLRDHGLLTVDARKKERKKYGQRGARRKFQFVKR